MNNFRRRSSSKKARVLVRQYSETTYYSPGQIRVISAMPFTIGKTNGSTASLDIGADFTIYSRTVYEYSDGSIEYGAPDDFEYTYNFRNAVISEDFYGKSLKIYSSADPSQIFIAETGYNGNNVQLPLPEEGQTVNIDATVIYPGANQNIKRLTVTIADTGDNYQVTITLLHT